MDYAPPLLGHPATLVILLYALVLLTLSFVGPQQLKLRLTVLLVLLAILCQFAATAPSHLHFTWLTILTAASSFLLLHYLDVGLIRRHECAKLQSKYDSPRNESSIVDRLYRGYLLLARWRKIDTPLEVKNVPRFPGNTPPSRRAFLAATATRFVTFWLVLDLIFMIRPARSHVAGAGSPTTTTLRDWFLDSLLKTTVMWSILWLIVNLTAAVASFPLVALGFSEPRDWRPVFGPFREAYTLRNYWGLFWHQLSRDFFSRPAEFVAHRVLGLSRTSGRWHVMHLKVLLTFAVSGMAHVFIDLSTGVEFGQSRSMEFFLLQACAIIFEDYVRLSLGDDKVTRPPQGWSLPVRMLGFVWVALWFTWTTPYWIELRSAVDDGIPALPFSVVSPVLRLISGGGER